VVKGLDLFGKHFASDADKYVLIGGTACSLLFEESGLDFRATKDLDLVLSIEALDAPFVSRFWQFVENGGYQHRQRSTGKQIFYRFSSPKNVDYPYMLELFTRAPDAIPSDRLKHLTPVPMDDGVKSLSAILLDDQYYDFLHSGRREVGGLPIVGAGHLIPLKARAWLDLSSRRDDGASVDQRDIRKHRNDVLRLTQLLSPTTEIDMMPSIQQDMAIFIDHFERDASLDLRSLGIQTSREQVIELLRRAYPIRA
jgi:hypothetical protein